jgi:RimJ/RimL family protein N-acetyltransferase
MNIQPVTLTGRLVRLEPVSLDHVPDLTAAGQLETIWRYMPYGLIRTEEQMAGLVRELLRRQERGTDLLFAVIHRPSNRAVGGTRYLWIDRPNRSLEIGGTWYAAEHQRTGVNTECKYLLLGHAFETLGCLRVQFRTDLRNERSQRAIERLGAIREGVLRDCLIMPDGYLRSTVVYSVLEREWPPVKARLERLMETHGGGGP